jgi:hypothetical protein
VKLIWAGLVLVAFVACTPPQPSGSPSASPSATATAKPTPTLQPATAGGIVQMGRTVITRTGSKVTVISWHLYANRSIPNGPGQVYETVNVSFCAGPQVQESAEDLAALFALELSNGNRVAFDSQSQPGEFRTKGTVNPGQCVSGPIVYQVTGGEKPQYVSFDATPPTKWTVP